VLDKADVLLNNLRMEKLIHRLAALLRRQLKPLMALLRNRPFCRRPSRRRRETQLEFRWNSKI
jgi:hypothetical protein